MGTKVALLVAQKAKIQTQLIFESEQAAGKTSAMIESWLENKTQQGNFSEDQKYDILKSFSFSLDLADAHNADLVLESVPETLDLKK